MTFKQLLFAALMGTTVHASAQSNSEKNNNTEKDWSVGINAGLMSPYSLLFFPNSAHNLELNIGYGAIVKRQFNKLLGVELSYQGGSVSDRLKSYSPGTSRRSFDTEIAYTTTLNAVINIADFNLGNKKQGFSIYGRTGAGFSAYAPSYVTGAGTEIDLKNNIGKDSDRRYYHAAAFPLGLGLKTKLSDVLTAHADYSVFIITRDNLDGPSFKGSDRYAYGSLGLEYSFGKR